jgi:hypothetical protein
MAKKKMASAVATVAKPKKGKKQDGKKAVAPSRNGVATDFVKSALQLGLDKAIKLLERGRAAVK